MLLSLNSSPHLSTLLSFLQKYTLCIVFLLRVSLRHHPFYSVMPVETTDHNKYGVDDDLIDRSLTEPPRYITQDPRNLDILEP